MGGRESRVWPLLLTALHSLMAVRDRMGAGCPSSHLVFCFYIEIGQGTQEVLRWEGGRGRDSHSKLAFGGCLGATGRHVARPQTWTGSFLGAGIAVMAPEPAVARQLPRSSSSTGSIAFLPLVRDVLVPVASSTHKASWVSATRHMLLGHPVGLCVSLFSP